MTKNYFSELDITGIHVNKDVVIIDRLIRMRNNP